jgi:uncharacterized protein
LKKIVFLVIGIIYTISVQAQTPQRKAFIGVIGKTSPQGTLLDSVVPQSVFDKLKIKKGDVILTVNNQETTTWEKFISTASPMRTRDMVTVAYLRNGKKQIAKTKAIMKPYETSEIADIYYNWVPFEKGFLRSITRKPKNKTNVPAILLIPGYGCGTIENYSKSYNGKLINEWIKNGYAVITIEKSGIGDSYNCEPCSEVDLQTDIKSFDVGYRFMENLPYVDKTKLFIWGHSMGGTIAPEVARLHNPKGVIVFACVFRPWNEFLLEMHRVQKPLLEKLTYQQTEEFLRGIQPIYHDFFNNKKSPSELFKNPNYRKLVASEIGYKEGSNDMWGRHWRFWQQLDELNLAKTWQEVNCPVLVIHGTSDYEQCSLVEPMLIQKTVNEVHPNFATWITIEGLDHFMMNSKNYQEAYKNFQEQQYNKGNFNYKIAEETIKWLKNQN